jgi:molybdopterin converting factor small subunit
MTDTNNLNSLANKFQHNLDNDKNNKYEFKNNISKMSNEEKNLNYMDTVNLIPPASGSSSWVLLFRFV